MNASAPAKGVSDVAAVTSKDERNAAAGKNTSIRKTSPNHRNGVFLICNNMLIFYTSNRACKRFLSCEEAGRHLTGNAKYFRAKVSGSSNGSDGGEVPLALVERQDRPVPKLAL